MSVTKKPWMKLYPADWRADPALRMCDPMARYVWLEMLMIMHEGEPYGHLTINSVPIADEALSRLIDVPVKAVKSALKELGRLAVFSVTDDGIIFSRRMVRDELKFAADRENGNHGGNPKLTTGYNKPGFVYAIHRASDNSVKIGISINPEKRISKIKEQYRGVELTLINKAFVADMGSTESEIHAKFAHRKTGEWFALDDKEIPILFHIFQQLNESPLKGDGEFPHKAQRPEARNQSKEFKEKTEPKGSIKKNSPEAILEILSEIFDADRSQAVFEYRRDSKKKIALTENSARLLVGKLKSCVDPAAAADEMILRGWTSVSQSWLDKGSPPSTAPPKSAFRQHQDECRAAIDREIARIDGNEHSGKIIDLWATTG